MVLFLVNNLELVRCLAFELQNRKRLRKKYNVLFSKKTASQNKLDKALRNLTRSKYECKRLEKLVANFITQSEMGHWNTVVSEMKKKDLNIFYGSNNGIKDIFAKNHGHYVINTDDGTIIYSRKLNGLADTRKTINDSNTTN